MTGLAGENRDPFRDPGLPGASDLPDRGDFTLAVSRHVSLTLATDCLIVLGNLDPLKVLRSG